MMPGAVKMMATAFVMMDGWVHTVKMFAQKVRLWKFTHKVLNGQMQRYSFYCLFCIGFYGKHCMEFCSCPSPQFVCHAAHGCVCRVGFSGTDCLTPRGQFQELNGGTVFKIKCLQIE